MEGVVWPSGVVGKGPQELAGWPKGLKVACSFLARLLNQGAHLEAPTAGVPGEDPHLLDSDCDEHCAGTLQASDLM